MNSKNTEGLVKYAFSLSSDGAVFFRNKIIAGRRSIGTITCAGFIITLRYLDDGVMWMILDKAPSSGALLVESEYRKRPHKAAHSIFSELSSENISIKVSDKTSIWLPQAEELEVSSIMGVPHPNTEREFYKNYSTVIPPVVISAERKGEEVKIFMQIGKCSPIEVEYGEEVLPQETGFSLVFRKSSDLPGEVAFNLHLIKGKYFDEESKFFECGIFPYKKWKEKTKGEPLYNAHRSLNGGWMYDEEGVDPRDYMRFKNGFQLYFLTEVVDYVRYQEDIFLPTEAD